MSHKLDEKSATVRQNLWLSERMKNNLIEMADIQGVSLNERTRQLIAGNEDYKIFENRRK